MNRTVNIELDNISCSGCANSISKSIRSISSSANVRVDTDKGTVEVRYESESDMIESFIRELTRIGYPPKGTTNMVQKVRSIVSCAVGKVDL